MICPDYQPRMLDLAYQLLEPAEAEAIRAHAASCTACAEALAEAGRVQGLMGRAAKLSFPEVRFEAPLAEVAAAKKKSAKAAWLPWVVAAAVLLAVGVTVSQQSGTNADDDGHAAISTEPPTKPADPTKPGVVIPNPRGLPESVQMEWTASTAAGAKSSFKILVIGPGKATVNAENTYSVSASDAKTKRLKVNVTVIVMDSANAVAFKKEFESGTTVTLPAAMWEKLAAGAVTMQVIAIHPASGDKIELNVPIR